MKLKCVAKECTWESQDLSEGLAEKTLLMHLQLAHQVPPTQLQGGGTGTKKLEPLHFYSMLVLHLGDVREMWFLQLLAIAY